MLLFPILLALCAHPGRADDHDGPPSPLLSWNLPVQWRFSSGPA